MPRRQIRTGYYPPRGQYQTLCSATTLHTIERIQRLQEDNEYRHTNNVLYRIQKSWISARNHRQWRENRIFASHNLDSGLTNIQKAWFGFDKARSNIRSRIFEYLTDYPIRHKNSWWPIISLIFSHKMVGWNWNFGITTLAPNMASVFNRQFRLIVNRNQWYPSIPCIH